jgi:hypothetical protein
MDRRHLAALSPIALRASPAVQPKTDYLNIWLGSHLFLYYLYFVSNSSNTT